ncbi:hypothetical protein HSBAA_29270 [Vreelandella sulfidaeris]|uniref:Uncharacterized protein n=1 Tax=Vreelandella sulfidaeris TaxID=115553 RepID=A0A455UAM3_9GAMM|nr:hypothetical protein HSBAA_29270 [Halomonas sulfidaeris]
MTEDKLTRQREQARLRRARYREGKVNVAFATSVENRDALLEIAEDYGYPSIKELLEALAKVI